MIYRGSLRDKEEKYFTEMEEELQDLSFEYPYDDEVLRQIAHDKIKAELDDIDDAKHEQRRDENGE